MFIYYQSILLFLCLNNTILTDKGYREKQDRNCQNISNLPEIAGNCLSSLQITSTIKLRDIRFSRRLSGFDIKTIVNLSLLSCQEECQRKVNCESINYNRMKKICEFNSAPQTESFQLKQEVGWVFGNINKRSQKTMNPCNSDICKQNKTCVEKEDRFKCKVDECQAPTVFENGTVLGNMNNIGSVRALKCHSGFTLIGSDNSVCTETGKWNSSEETKCEMLCQSPQSSNTLLEIKDIFVKTPDGTKYVTASNMSDLSSLMIMQGSNATYKCKNGMYAIRIPVSQCIAGAWSTPSTICIDQCPPYLSYSYSLYECVRLDSCVNGYRNTFQKYESTVMYDNDHREIQGIAENDCLQTCVADPACNSFDYCNGHSSCPLEPKCFIQRLQGVTNPIIRTYKKWTYYQRNCK